MMGGGVTLGNILHVVARTPRAEISKWQVRVFYCREGEDEEEEFFTPGVRQESSFHLFQPQVKRASKSSTERHECGRDCGFGRQRRRLSARMPLATNPVLLYKRRDES